MNFRLTSWGKYLKSPVIFAAFACISLGLQVFIPSHKHSSVLYMFVGLACCGWLTSRWYRLAYPAVILATLSQVLWSDVSFNPVTWTPSHYFIILSQCKKIECLLKHYNFCMFLPLCTYSRTVNILLAFSILPRSDCDGWHTHGRLALLEHTRVYCHHS